jgi:hypothetical protein
VSGSWAAARNWTETIIVCRVNGSTHAGMSGFAALQEQTNGRPRRVLGMGLRDDREDAPCPDRPQHGKLIELGRDLTDEHPPRGLGRYL